MALPSPFSIPPPRQTISMDAGDGSKDQVFTRQWFLFFHQIYKRLADDNFDPDDAGQSPAASFDTSTLSLPDSSQAPQVAGLAERITELEKRLNDLSQGTVSL